MPEFDPELSVPLTYLEAVGALACVKAVLASGTHMISPALQAAQIKLDDAVRDARRARNAA